MNDLLAALLLGIIEGITEFLPISSTGHLLIAERWLGHRSDLFNISIQAGAILAVVLIYWQRLVSLTVGFREPRKRDYALKLALAFAVTAVLGVLVKKLGFELPETIAPVAWALLLGGFVILGVEAIDARRADLPDDDPDAIGWGTAVLVGLAQVLAGVFPGTSRSAAAIFAALLFGKSSRLAATEFAFLVGIPTMFAATGYELVDMVQDGRAANEDWTALAVAFVASAITAFVAVKWLLRYIQTHRFTIFAWYRIALGAALLVWLAAGTNAPSAVGAAAAKSGAIEASRARDAAPSDAAPSELVRAGAGSWSGTIPASTSLAELDAGRAQAIEIDPVIAHFRYRQGCITAAIKRRLLARPEVEGFLETLASQSPEMAANRAEMIARTRRELDELDRIESQCDESVAQMTDGSIYELALQAALRGDREAAVCYVTGSFPIPDQMWKRAEVQERFRVNATRLVERGIAEGDWRMVGMAELASGVGSHRDSWPRDFKREDAWSDPGLLWFARFTPRGDPRRSYALNRLRQLGETDPDFRSQAQWTAKEVGQKLTPAERHQGDAWARATFQRNFGGKPKPETLPVCGFGSD